MSESEEEPHKRETSTTQPANQASTADVTGYDIHAEPLHR
jgi:hypothetical protein